MSRARSTTGRLTVRSPRPNARTPAAREDGSGRACDCHHPPGAPGLPVMAASALGPRRLQLRRVAPQPIVGVRRRTNRKKSASASSSKGTPRRITLGGRPETAPTGRGPRSMNTMERPSNEAGRAAACPPRATPGSAPRIAAPGRRGHRLGGAPRLRRPGPVLRHRADHAEGRPGVHQLSTRPMRSKSSPTARRGRGGAGALAHGRPHRPAAPGAGSWRSATAWSSSPCRRRTATRPSPRPGSASTP